jgi:osmotically-inducible protein OsmY
VLCGTVSSFRLRQKAQDVIRKIPGISTILNELVIGSLPIAMVPPSAH